MTGRSSQPNHPSKRKHAGITSRTARYSNRRMPPNRGLLRKAGRNRSTTTRSISSYTSGMLASVSRENSHTRAVGPRFTRSRTRSSVPVVGGDGSDDIAIGLQGVGQRPFGPIAQLGEARREAAVEDDKELVSQLDGRPGRPP